MIRTIVLVAVFGAFGSIVRMLLQHLLGGLNDSFPFGTFLANTAGCLLAGFMLGKLSEYSPDVVSAVLTGFLGGLTTFSGLVAEMTKLHSERGLAIPTIYGVVSVLAGLIVCYAGRSLSMRF